MCSYCNCFLSGDAPPMEAERVDGIAAQQLVDLPVIETRTRADLGGDLLGVGPRRIGMWEVDLERDLVDADAMTQLEAGLVVEDAEVDPAGDRRGRRLGEIETERSGSSTLLPQ